MMRRHDGCGQWGPIRTWWAVRHPLGPLRCKDLTAGGLEGVVEVASSVKDVAARAGVSPKTVSNVVHERSYVASDTRARVKAAMVELGYQPNLSARSLRSGRTGLLNLAIPMLAAPYFAELAHVLIEAAARRGYTVLIEETDGAPERERRALVGAVPHLADGVIISPLGLEPTDFDDIEPAAPIVLLGERVTGAQIDHVAIDNEAAARDATHHLLSGGRTRLAALGFQSDPKAATAHLRYRGFTAGLETAGATPMPGGPVPVAGYGWDDGARAVDALSARAEMPDGIVCFNDELAVGALRRLHELGWEVPGDIAVVGFDDIAGARLSVPSLSTIAPDKHQLAEQAIACLADRIEDADIGVRDVIVPHRLIIRESTRRMA